MVKVRAAKGTSTSQDYLRSESMSKFHTPLPGKDVVDESYQTLRRAFLHKFRVFDPGIVPNNIPTACLLKGDKEADYLNSPQFLTRRVIFFFLESAFAEAGDEFD